jgi:hypothetical protein
MGLGVGAVARSGGRCRSRSRRWRPADCHCDDYGPVLAPCPVPNPTILGKDEAMHVTTLHTQADLWQHGAATFAALFMEGQMRSPEDEVDCTGVLLHAVMNRGLRLATEPAPAGAAPASRLGDTPQLSRSIDPHLATRPAPPSRRAAEPPHRLARGSSRTRLGAALRR